MYSDIYQKILITLGVVATVLFGVFFYREMFPEYRIYQDDYIALEKFRSTYTGESPPVFKPGVKQIVFEREDKGPARVDRCISCHVATQLPHFSPTKLKTDAQGNIIRNKDGIPEQEPNNEYVWARLDAKILELRQMPNGAGEKQAAALEALKTAHVDEQVYDVTKVLRMHPLIGKETRPFEFHPIDEYGCTSCHSGNGRALTTDKAHGPVFDGRYEEEFVGNVPHFTEVDEQNDPQFSRVFNHKPGDSLLFQTSPILVGALLQARCINCHKPAEPGTPFDADGAGSIAELTKDYLRGRELYISQACYACHKIATFSRGGVGPELTKAGGTYPWYLKTKMVWPQGDLKTSTMPNYAMDHVELEDLMTFLLSQNGQGKAISEIEYKNAVQQWDAGKKLPWEKEITPSQVHDLRYSMTVFATEGCSACHRLEGFESNIGFAVEKQKGVSFDVLYDEKQWFQKLFPEEIHGSDIVKAIDTHAEEIDKRIVDGVRSDGILESIEKIYPDAIEALYYNFRFASRAKNAAFQDALKAAANDVARDKIKKDQEAWQERVHRILMMYVQEYGLGRLIGPRPNWSGVYRSDEWLIQHFRNPTAYVPRSLMPIFPFDDTKFYALTHMLDVLGKKNRDAVRAIWEHKGFMPEKAYAIHCSQCHGTYLQGNGPVAAWIYPIPKNLRNAEFMRNLTKENAIVSITHGVKGTPMAPWGETPKDKENYDGIPVLNHDEIAKLVDWLYTSLPGGTIIKGSQDVPKWHYTPEDVLKDLENEGSYHELMHPTDGWDLHSLLHKPEWDTYYAALEPKVAVLTSPIFDVVQNPAPIGDKYFYYIKKSFYTPENLAEGKAFFELNCAVCHGNDADGTGTRSAIMTDAKPRMLTNLDWIENRDDLRLLRSIKYGVPGTAMTPWGDLTNGKQRLQLVAYIRSLSFEKERRRQLLDAVYGVFEKEKQELETERSKQYGKINELQSQYDAVMKEQKEAADSVRAGKLPAKDAVALYQKQLDLGEQLAKEKAQDTKLADQQDAVQKKWASFNALGNDFISANVDDTVWGHVVTFISSGGKNKEDAIAIAASLDAQIESAMKEREIALGKIDSPQRDEELRTLLARIEGYKKLKNTLLSTMPARK